MTEAKAVQNTTRELHREDTADPAGSYYESSVHVTADGRIGMNVGGTVLTRSIREWHALASRRPSGGEIVARPKRRHKCDPGLRWEWAVGSDGHWPLPFGHYYGIPPSAYEYPAGTVWRCDCGRTWVSTGPVADNAPGLCSWRREGRFARWRRERGQS